MEAAGGGTALSWLPRRPSAGGGVGTASLGAEEVQPLVRQAHDHLTAPEGLAVQTGDDVLPALNADLFGGDDPDQLGGQIAVLPGGVGGEQPGKGDLGNIFDEHRM